MDSVFFSLLLNIGLLVLIATMLTKFSFIRQLFLKEDHSSGNRMALAVIFALASILSTYTGIRTNGAIINTRVIGVLTAGLLGGPYVGIGAAVIAAAHRYLFDIGGFTSIPCMLSTLMEGLIGAAFSRRFQAGKLKLTGVFFITMLAEIGQMVIILLLARPFGAALELVRIIALPMIIMNAVGMVIFITTFNRVFMEEDSNFAKKVRLAFDIADKSLPYLRKGLYSKKDIQETTRIIYEADVCTAVMITDRQTVLAAYSGEPQKLHLEPEVLMPVIAPAEPEVRIFTECRTEEPLYPILKKYTLIAAPLLDGEVLIGNLVMVVKRKPHTSQATVSFARELAKLFSTQLELANLDYQKNLRRKAELEALQSQVNPHFLYNALNTIACVCRENPDRARTLIHTLSDYYRQTLENDRNMVNLHTELFHISKYLELEKARFEEKLVVELQADEEADCMVPAFILQPLVENAVKHGADRNGNRYVSIRTARIQDAIQISVRDHGRGFPEEAVEHPDLLKQTKGIGLRNVDRRLKGMYKEQGGLSLENTTPGAVVSFCIPFTDTKEEPA